MNVTFKKLHPHIGAEVSPLDLRQVHDRAQRVLPERLAVAARHRPPRARVPVEAVRLEHHRQLRPLGRMAHGAIRAFRSAPARQSPTSAPLTPSAAPC